MSRYSSGIVVLSLLLCGCSSEDRAARPTVKDLDSLSRQRSEVSKTIRDGYFVKTKYEDEARVWIGPKFSGLTHEQKTDLLDLVIADCYLAPKGSKINPGEKVLIFDGEKQIGQYDASGLDLY